MFLLVSAAAVRAEETFLLTGVSKNFDVRVVIEKCEDDVCEGKGTFHILKKNQKRVFQTIQMPDARLKITENTRKKGNETELYGDGYTGVEFTDFNFDGAEDLSISNGVYGPYGSISDDYFLYEGASGKFVRHKQLTDIASENMFVEVKLKEKVLETFTKSGCCWHQTAQYKFIGNRLQKIYVFTEDAMNSTDGKMKLITEKLVNGKWEKTTETVVIDDYYKDQ